MAERKGARYRIDPAANRAASHHGEHTQRTQATEWALQQEAARAIPAGGRKDPRFYPPENKGYPVGWKD